MSEYVRPDRIDQDVDLMYTDAMEVLSYLESSGSPLGGRGTLAWHCLKRYRKAGHETSQAHPAVIYANITLKGTAPRGDS